MADPVDYNAMAQMLLHSPNLLAQQQMQAPMPLPAGGGGGFRIAPGGGRLAPTKEELLRDPSYVQSRIRQIEYDRRLAGRKVDGQYPPHGELSMLRRTLKELLGGQ